MEVFLPVALIMEECVVPIVSFVKADAIPLGRLSTCVSEKALSLPKPAGGPSLCNCCKNNASLKMERNNSLFK